jgi:cysteine desulfuration protein SufE
MMMTIEQQKQELLEEFELFDDWMDKYNYIIEMGKDLKGLPEENKTKQFLISGCQSQVWLTAKYEDGKIHFEADSDAIITKGIVQLLIKVVDNRSPQEIVDEDFSFLDKIGLKEHLSPTRSNGLTSMIKQIKLYALVFKTKEEQK